MDVARNALDLGLAYPPSEQAVPEHQDRKVRYKSNKHVRPWRSRARAASGEGGHFKCRLFLRASRRHALKNVESAKTHCVCFVEDATNGTSQELRRHDIVQ